MVLSQIYGLIYGHSKFAINFTMSYMIVKRVLKIDLEIAEILEVKVSSFNIEIVFLPHTRRKALIWHIWKAYRPKDSWTTDYSTWLNGRSWDINRMPFGDWKVLKSPKLTKSWKFSNKTESLIGPLNYIKPLQILRSKMMLKMRIHRSLRDYSYCLGIKLWTKINAFKFLTLC